MNRDCTLTRNERLILFWITKNSKKEKKKRVSNISRTKLSQLSGIKDLVTISEVTKSLEEKGCLAKAHKRDEEGKLLSCYHIH